MLTLLGQSCACPKDLPAEDATLPAGVWWQSFILEIALTFMLLFVVLNVTVGATEKGITAGFAIGGVITFEVLCGGPISGASTARRVERAGTPATACA